MSNRRLRFALIWRARSLFHPRRANSAQLTYTSTSDDSPATRVVRVGGFPRSYLTITLEYVTKFRTPRGFARTPTSLVGEECADLCRIIGDFQGRGASSLVSYVG